MSEREPHSTSNCCCSANATIQIKQQCCNSFPASGNEPWIVDSVDSPIGQIPRVSTELRFEDRVGSWKARWGINRMNYRIEPGLYAVGKPSPQSPLLVSANYKMSFDRLRSQLGGRDFWILVLETYGINVWCAAGKGTFGTEEIVRRIQATRLSEVLNHRRIILPQLGAPGVDMHEVKRQSGFRVVYGPVRSKDIPAFIDGGMNASPEMRKVRFSFSDRIVLIPIELVTLFKYALILSVCLFLLAGLYSWGYSFERTIHQGTSGVLIFMGAYLFSVILTPALLPWLPGRSFAAKGAWIGLAYTLGITVIANLSHNGIGAASWLLLCTAAASFTSMNFTGASTYTSLSGVRKEMRAAVPLQIAGAALGVGLWLVGRFV